MNVEERKRLLRELASLTHREAENVPPLRRFLPLPAHALALRDEYVVIRGGRGAGKSALFGLLNALGDSARAREFFGDSTLPDARWLDAFSQAADHPHVDTLDQFASQATGDERLRTFWMVHLLARADAVFPGLTQIPPKVAVARQGHENEPQAWIEAAESELGAVASALDLLERNLAKKSLIAFAAYDHLDRIGAFSRSTRRRYVSALLSLWLSLSNRFRHLRGKIFLREDLFDEGERGSPDASKLRPRSVSLEWDVASLYRVLVRHMVELPGMKTWLDGVKGLAFSTRQDFGAMPGEMAEPVQKALADRLAGELMGKGVGKGYTYRWIPNRLQDAQVRIVPRSILSLVGFAAGRAEKKPLSKGTRLLSPQDLQGALVPTSNARVGEIQEEYPFVGRLENLRGLHVLLERRDVVERLQIAPEAAQVGPQQSGEVIFDELVRLGVLKIREDGRVDVPDIYRYGYGILRKGGVARPK